MPFGWIHPNFQPSRMLAKSAIESPTRQASASAIFWFLDFPLEALLIKKKAAVKVIAMATNAKMMKYFMDWIIS